MAAWLTDRAVRWLESPSGWEYFEWHGPGARRKLLDVFDDHICEDWPSDCPIWDGSWTYQAKAEVDEEYYLRTGRILFL